MLNRSTLGIKSNKDRFYKENNIIKKFLLYTNFFFSRDVLLQYKIVTSSLLCAYITSQ